MKPPPDWKAYTPKKGDKLVTAPLLKVLFVITKDPCPSRGYFQYHVREYTSGCKLGAGYKKQGDAVKAILSDFGANETQRENALKPGGMLHPDNLERSRVNAWKP